MKSRVPLLVGLLVLASLANPWARAQDVSEAGVLRFLWESVAASEQDGLVEIWIVREPGGVGPATVMYSLVGGTAEAGKDFEEASQLVVFSDPSVKYGAILVPIVDDQETEEPELFQVILHDPVGVNLGTPAVLTVQVFDDDSIPPGGALSFAAASSEVRETDGTVYIQVERTAGAKGEASAQCVVASGTADPELDYQFTTVILTWAEGDMEPKVVPVAILDDRAVEGWEDVVLGLRNVAGATLFGPSQARVLIQDDEYVAPDLGEGQTGSSGMAPIQPCFIGSLF